MFLREPVVFEGSGVFEGVGIFEGAGVFADKAPLLIDGEISLFSFVCGGESLSFFGPPLFCPTAFFVTGFSGTGFFKDRR